MRISVENVIRTYRFYAPLYDWLFGAVLGPGRIAMAKKVASLRPLSILEVGIGTGLSLDHYPAAAAVVGIDLSHEMLDVARQRAARLKRTNVDLRHMNAETMSFADSSFDCVTVPYVLSVTPNPEVLVAEIRRVCRKDGTILIVNHFSGSRFWWILERAVRSFADRVGFRSTFTYEEHVLKHDWEVQSVEDVNLLNLSKLVVIRNK
jgi:phosphatidylethanolamine/phosphatidyl-N-methylethanolamine N-methyltransferase